MKKIIIAFLVFVSFNTKAQFSGGGSSSSENVLFEKGEQIFGSTGSSASFINLVNGTFTIPTAGEWRITYNIYYTPTEINESAQYRLVNVSAGNTVVPNSLAAVANTAVSGHIDQTTSQTVYVNVAAPTQFSVQGLAPLTELVWSSGTSIASSKVIWEKVNGFIPVSGQTVDYLFAGAGESGGIQTTLQSFTNIPIDISVPSTTFRVALNNRTQYNFSGLTVVNNQIVVNKTGVYEFISNCTFEGLVAGYLSTNLLVRNGTTILAKTGFRDDNNLGQNPVSSAISWIGSLTAGDVLDLRVAAHSGPAQSLDLTTYQVSVKQLGSSAVGTTPVNDQASSGYIDIGNVRMQWGRTTNGFNGARTIALPAAFANTNYTVTATAFSTGSSTQLSRTVFLGDYTTSTFIGRCVTGNDSSSGVDWNWIAFGQKP